MSETRRICEWIWSCDSLTSDWRTSESLLQLLSGLDLDSRPADLRRVFLLLICGNSAGFTPTWRSCCCHHRASLWALSSCGSRGLIGSAWPLNFAVLPSVLSIHQQTETLSLGEADLTLFWFSRRRGRARASVCARVHAGQSAPVCPAAGCSVLKPPGTLSAPRALPGSPRRRVFTSHRGRHRAAPPRGTAATRTVHTGPGPPAHTRPGKVSGNRFAFLFSCRTPQGVRGAAAAAEYWTSGSSGPGSEESGSGEPGRPAQGAPSAAPPAGSPRCWKPLKRLQDVRLCLQLPPHRRHRVSVRGGFGERLYQHAGVSPNQSGNNDHFTETQT